MYPDEVDLQDYDDARTPDKLIEIIVADLHDWQDSRVPSEHADAARLAAVHFHAQHASLGLRSVPRELIDVLDWLVELREALRKADKEPTKPGPEQEPKLARMTWLAKAMLLVQEHTDWSNARIAGIVGVHPSTLSRSEHYQAAAKIAREGEGRPKGFAKTDPDNHQRNLEAIDPDAEEGESLQD